MYKLHLRLNKCHGIEIFEDEFNGEVVSFIKMPMEVNGIYISNKAKNTIGWDFWMRERAINQYQQTHYICPNIRGEELRKKFEENGWYDQIRFLGVAKDFGSKRMQSSEGRKLVKQNDEMYGMDNE